MKSHLSDKTTPLVASSYLYRIVLVAAIGGFLFGYDMALISGAVIFLKTEFGLNPLWYGIVVGSAMLGCPFGPLLGVWVADALGRKRTLVVCALLFVVSGLGCANVDTKLWFIFWRFIGGVGVGLASTVSPMYIAEISPAHLRGRLGVVNQLAIVVGISMAVFVTYQLSFDAQWRWMFASLVFPVIGLLVGLAFVPESPRWLALRGRSAEASAVLTRISGVSYAETELAAIQASSANRVGHFRELFEPGIRSAVVVGTLLMVFSQINGVNILLMYAPTLLLETGLTTASNAILNSVYIYSWIILCTLTAFWIVRTFGRRQILISGAIAMAVGHGLMFVSFEYRLSPLWTVIIMLVPAGAFTLTLAPMSWVVLSEIFPNRLRGKAMSLATGVMFAANYTNTNLFPLVMTAFKNRFGHPGGTFLIFALVCVLCSIFVWRMVPETKGKTLEEIEKLWQRTSG